MVKALLIPVLCLLTAPFVAAAGPQNAAAEDSQIAAVVDGLRSQDFNTRVQASERLKEASITDLQQISDLPGGECNAEVAARLFVELEARYMSDDAGVSGAASDLLERLTQSDRLLLADGSQRILEKRWQRRVEVAGALLESMGAEFREGSLTGALGMQFPQRSTRTDVQVFIGEEWTGGDRGIAVIERLSILAGARAGLRLWLLEGHPLNEEQHGRLRDLVGENGIAERSRVALGILAEPNFEPGVRVRHVNAGSSAADAKIRVGDILKAMLTTPPADGVLPEEIEINEAQKLKDFDHLVERLKQFREGDDVWLVVRRGLPLPMNGAFIFPPQRPDPLPNRRPTTELIKVTLKGWDKLESTQN